MKKKIFLLFVIFAAAVVNTFPAFGSEQAPKLTIDAKSSILMEPKSGEILFMQDPDERLALASVTKVMTILLIYEALSDGRIGMDDIVTISEHASKMGGSQIFLEPNEQQTVRDLVKSIIIASANDASVAMAEFISGSEESFVDMMNRKAAELGMINTNFKNACGLDAEGHFSSARDVAIMSAVLINKYPEAFDYTTTWQDSITHKTARGESEFGLTNTNKLIKWYNGATGLKTGSTSQALYCLSGTAERDGLKLIAVVLGAPSPSVRFQEVMKMFDYGYANFRLAKGTSKGTVVAKTAVYKGTVDETELVVKDDISAITSKKNQAELQQEIIVEPGIEAPVLKGDKGGVIIYTLDGKEVGRSDLIVLEDIQRIELPGIMKKLIDSWFK